MKSFFNNRISRIGQHRRSQDDTLTYKNALLDARLRHFFDTEFNTAQPPAGAFGKVLWAINAGVRPCAQSPHGRLGIALSTLVHKAHQSVTTPGMAYVGRGGAVIILLLVALGTYTTQVRDYVPRGQTTATPTSRPAAIAARYSTDAAYIEDIPVYDPVELRIQLSPYRAKHRTNPTEPNRRGPGF